MSIQVAFILGGVAALAGAVVSIRESALGFKDGYKLRKEGDPFGFWGAVACLTLIGLLGIASGLGWPL
jgi:hypothetical protein